jgi:hypothetical protein
MYSNVTYASPWNATNGFSESMLELLPSRNTPPFLTELPDPLLPQAAAASVTTAATAISRAV